MFPIPLCSNFRHYISPSSITKIFRLLSTPTYLMVINALISWKLSLRASKYNTIQ